MTEEVATQAREIYEAPAVTDLGAVDKFSQGDTFVSIDDE